MAVPGMMLGGFGSGDEGLSPRDISRAQLDRIFWGGDDAAIAAAAFSPGSEYPRPHYGAQHPDPVEAEIAAAAWRPQAPKRDFIDQLDGEHWRDGWGTVWDD